MALDSPKGASKGTLGPSIQPRASLGSAQQLRCGCKMVLDTKARRISLAGSAAEAGTDRGPTDHTNIRILQNRLSKIPLSGASEAGCRILMIVWSLGPRTDRVSLSLLASELELRSGFAHIPDMIPYSWVGVPMSSPQILRSWLCWAALAVPSWFVGGFQSSSIES